MVVGLEMIRVSRKREKNGQNQSEWIASTEHKLDTTAEREREARNGLVGAGEG